MARADRYRRPGTLDFTLEQIKQLAKHLVLSALARARRRHIGGI